MKSRAGMEALMNDHQSQKLDMLLIQEPSIIAYRAHVNHSVWRLYQPTAESDSVRFRSLICQSQTLHLLSPTSEMQPPGPDAIKVWTADSQTLIFSVYIPPTVTNRPDLLIKCHLYHDNYGSDHRGTYSEWYLQARRNPTTKPRTAYYRADWEKIGKDVLDLFEQPGELDSAEALDKVVERLTRTTTANAVDKHTSDLRPSPYSKRWLSNERWTYWKRLQSIALTESPACHYVSVACQEQPTAFKWSAAAELLLCCGEWIPRNILFGPRPTIFLISTIPENIVIAIGDQQRRIFNTIGRGIVDACEKAGNEGRKFRVTIVIPAIPGFAGDLRDNAATGTRAIMDYQYKSICRGEHSIYGQIEMGRSRRRALAPAQVVVFALRAYDRINKTPALEELEKQADVTYQDIQRGIAESIMSESVHPTVGKDGDRNEKDYTADPSQKKVTLQKLEKLEEKAEQREAKDGFHSNDTEELYVHGKVCFVDDRTMFCGSANKNDRTMNGRPYRAARLAATLRRQLWRKHLGLLPAQEYVGTGHHNARSPAERLNEIISGTLYR
ncbi:hypothetical protein PENARI_c068G12249 [Penicillium arizonense]|uniref:phospholipase D n=1 Tax=Penicillium arizonense TaxID=1835702 RepID=A0A1F5L1K0_PENAI|nr:hypothetical protein PENARI_c068G12249 [Penicillium arizonense]OGE47072.1 hypothetical protein PENARI_c068G12249 [Penicillium arizonense]